MDIVLTIPIKEYKNDDLETQDYLNDKDNSRQFWTLSKIPKNLKVGDRIYFVKYKRIDSSMLVEEILSDSVTKCDTTERVWSGKCQIFMIDLREENFTEIVKGFQGFRYRWW
jgi:hypothetical protein